MTAVVFLTGCSRDTETLHCTFTTEGDGITIDATEIIEIVDGKMRSRTMTMETIATDEMTEYLEAIGASIDSEDGFGALNGMSGVEYISEMRDGTHFLEFRIDYTKVDSEEIENQLSPAVSAVFYQWDQIISARRVRERLENEGYICR